MVLNVGQSELISGVEQKTVNMTYSRKSRIFRGGTLKIVIFFYVQEVLLLGDKIFLKAKVLPYTKKLFPSSMQGGCSRVRFRPPTETVFLTSGVRLTASSTGHMCNEGIF